MRVTREKWGRTSDGQIVERFRLANDSGFRVELTNFGACVLSVEAPDRDDRSANVNHIYPTFSDYESNPSYFGATVGRFANRIGLGRCELDGRTYALAVNNGPHHLHGGLRGFTHRVWEPTVIEEVQVPGTTEIELAGVGFQYTSPDDEEGYPGTLSVRVAGLGSQRSVSGSSDQQAHGGERDFQKKHEHGEDGGDQDQ